MTRAGLTAIAEGPVHVSPITVWEVERKVAIGKLPSPIPSGVRGSYVEFLAREGFVVAPFTWADAALAATLPSHHHDPMDRMLIATALRMDLTVVTADHIFQSYGVRTIW